MLENIFKGSWKTTVIGVVTGLVIVLTQVKNLIDGDPSTAFDMNIMLGGLGVMGIGMFARDNNKTSEAAGAKPPDPTDKPYDQK